MLVVVATVASTVVVAFFEHSTVGKPIVVLESSSPKSLWSLLVGPIVGLIVVVLEHWPVGMPIAVVVSSWPRSQQSFVVVVVLHLQQLHQQQLLFAVASAFVVVAFAFIGSFVAFGSFAVG